MNRSKIKDEAKKKIQNNLWTFWKPFLIVMAITAVIEGGLSLIFIIPSNNNVGMIGLTNNLSIIIILPIIVGLTKWCLNFVRGKDTSVEVIFSEYKNILIIFLVYFLSSLFIGLWSLLLIIPGIIATYSYSMIYYILAEGKETSTMEVLKKSKEMMNGYKMDYFVFQLSFIGWMLLTSITFGIAGIWVIPYVSTSCTLYYEKLKAQTK